MSERADVLVIGGGVDRRLRRRRAGGARRGRDAARARAGGLPAGERRLRQLRPLVPSEIEPLAAPRRARARACAGCSTARAPSTSAPREPRPGALAVAVPRRLRAGAWRRRTRPCCASSARRARACTTSWPPTAGERWHYRRNGWLSVYETATGLDAARGGGGRRPGRSACRVDVLSAADVRERVPQVRAGSVAGGVLHARGRPPRPGARSRARWRRCAETRRGDGRDRRRGLRLRARADGRAARARSARPAATSPPTRS